MSTNYYVLADATCNNPDHTERLHIGKSSGGWKFGFHGIPEHNPPLTSWAAWRAFLADRTIEDEYGQHLTLAEFADVVEKRPASKASGRPICRVDPTPAEIRIGYGGVRYGKDDYHDAEGFDFYDGEFC